MIAALVIIATLSSVVRALRELLLLYFLLGYENNRYVAFAAYFVSGIVLAVFSTSVPVDVFSAEGTDWVYSKTVSAAVGFGALGAGVLFLGLFRWAWEEEEGNAGVPPAADALDGLPSAVPVASASASASAGETDGNGNGDGAGPGTGTERPSAVG